MVKRSRRTKFINPGCSHDLPPPPHPRHPLCCRPVRSDRRPGADLHAAQGPSLSLKQALLALAGFTLLNPHVYLDTVMLVGSVGAQQSADVRLAFMAGAASGSLLWFTLLGYGARWLAPLFARPRAWQILDGVIGLTMLALAAMLLVQV